MPLPLLKRAIIWFRNDLRLHDHEALSAAATAADGVLPVFVSDSRQQQPVFTGFPKMGHLRTNLLQQALNNLNDLLQSHYGAELLVDSGLPEQILAALMQQYAITDIYFYHYPGTEEQQVADAVVRECQSLGVQVHAFAAPTMYHPADLPFELDNLPPVFTHFRKLVEKHAKVRQPLPRPPQLNPIPLAHSSALDRPNLPEEQAHPNTVWPFRGGEEPALQRLKYYLWDTDHVSQYKYTRNGLLGVDYSSKLSPWLALGCISARSIYEEVKQYEEQRQKNVSTYWLVFELLWRDYFQLVALQSGAKLFLAGGIKGECLPSNQNTVLFEAWRLGNTGIPFIDANMRELLHTGYMSNRGRQNVASFLVHDLQIDWRWGAAWFESQLLDYDVASNYGNWNYVAGIGNDPRENRYFNILTQAERYDKKGAYVRQWIPELQQVPTQWVHQPYLLLPEQQQLLGLSAYPRPVLDVKQWRSYVGFNRQ